GEADRGAIFYTLGITQHVCGTDNVQSLSNLALMTGNLGREGTGVNPMRGQNNVQGSGDSGALPTRYPGAQPVNSDECCAKFSELYGKKLSTEPGLTKISAFKMAGNTIRAMFICGENSVVSDADRHHSEKALKSLDHLVVSEIFLTETAEYADVVFPASAWAETEGTFTNTERRVQRVRKAVSPQGESKPDWWIIAELAKRLDIPGFEYNSPEEIFNELCSVSPPYKGLSWDRVDRGKYQWPVPHKDHPGTPRLHEDGFGTGNGIFKLINYRKPAESLSAKFPIWLTTGRRLPIYHTNTQTGRSIGIDYLVPGEFLEVHPEDLIKWGLKHGDICQISSVRGAIKIEVRSTQRSQKGTVFSSFSFNDAPINYLTTSKGDQMTQTPEVKVCPVAIEALK
ncbi:MAG: molybdopterin-dependent oxidoreductase, partial [Proteobacteria bacterium]|nr:molybdopterin-dependent oxidoreductase [Pseudomonadota bacterium]